MDDMEEFKSSRRYRMLSIALVILAVLSLIPTMIFLYGVYQSIEPTNGTDTVQSQQLSLP